mgnify:FL=1
MGGLAVLGREDADLTGGHPADHAAEQLCIQHHLAGFLDIGFDGGHDAHFQIVAGKVELEAFGFQQDTFQHRDGRTHGDGFGHTIDGCAQQNFITYDVQTEFSPLFFVSEVVLCLKTVSEPVYLIELVVVTVVGGGELVENPEKPCRNAGVLVSTGL